MSRPLCVASKRPGHPQVMAAVAGLKDCLVFVLDKVTKRRSGWIPEQRSAWTCNRSGKQNSKIWTISAGGQWQQDPILWDQETHPALQWYLPLGICCGSGEQATVGS